LSAYADIPGIEVANRDRAKLIVRALIVFLKIRKFAGEELLGRLSI
jgi:hypothetical protein